MKKISVGFIFSLFLIACLCSHWQLWFKNHQSRRNKQIYHVFFLCFIRIPNWFLHLEIWTPLSVSIWITRTDTWRSIGISNIVWWLTHQWKSGGALIQLTMVLLCGQYLYCMISKWMISDMKESSNFVNKKNYIVCTQLMM